MRATGGINVSVYSTKKNMLFSVNAFNKYFLSMQNLNKKCRPVIIDNIMIFETEDKEYYKSLWDTIPYNFE